MTRKPGRVSGHIRELILSRRLRGRHEKELKLKEKEHVGRFYGSYLMDPDYYRVSHYILKKNMDTFTDEERKFYNFFMDKKPGQTFGERMEFARLLSEHIIINMRRYTPEEKKFFEILFGEFKQKQNDPLELIKYVFRLQMMIERSKAKGMTLDPEKLFSEEEVTEPTDYSQ